MSRFFLLVDLCVDMERGPSGSNDTEANGSGKVLAVFTYAASFFVRNPLLLSCLNPRRVSWVNNSARFKVIPCIERPRAN